MAGASFIAGLGSQWILGGSGAAYETTLAERFALLAHTGRVTTLGVELRHARPGLADGGALFYDDGTGAPVASAGSGYRDELFLGLVIGLSFDAHAQLPSDRPRVEIRPLLGFSLGALFTDTQLSLAGFDGPTPYRGRSVDPQLGVGTGVEFRFIDWLSVSPRLDAAVTVATDEHEVVPGERWGAEWRLVPAIDLGVRF